MEQNILISVIVPVYNTKEYLPRCVASILNQTYQNLELILVDDGSTDGTEVLCDSLATQDKRIRVFHKENGGSSSARNLGIAKANGVYLGFVDSDDHIDPDMYERLLAAAVQMQCDIVQVGRDEVDDKGNRLPNICEPPIKDTFYPAQEFLQELLLHKGDCSFCTKLVKKTLLETDRFPEGALNEDFHLLIRLLMKTKGVLSLRGQCYHVYYRIGSNTRKKDKNEFSRVYGDCVDNADMVFNIIKGQFPELCEIAMRFGLFQRLEYLLHIPIAQMTKKNAQYHRICIYLKKHMHDILFNKYLTRKNKIYLFLFSVAPKGIRQIHAYKMRFRKERV